MVVKTTPEKVAIPEDAVAVVVPDRVPFVPEAMPIVTTNEEFETVFPDSVGISKAGEDGIEYKNINYETLIPTLTKAIQEQQALITSQASLITDMQAKLKAANIAGF